VSERAVQRTDAPNAPWLVVEGADRHHREVTVGRALLTALRARLNGPRATPAPPPALPPRRGPTVLDALDLSVAFDARAYADEVERLQGRLNALSRHKRFGRISVAVAFEGPDAAGKGGAIKRVTQALDARFCRVIPIAAPTDEERAQPYLWRFWRHLPRRGHVAIFDRSWYGRVLVERVEGFAAEADWRRAYGEINDFEEELARHGVVLAKFWLQIDKAEQAKRFKERASVAHKRFKLTPEDWRNRRKWDAYQAAVCDMVERTGTERAPWTLVEANDKRWARVKVLRTLCERIETAL
jgi:AMP-polyphosphate phosphotransferase